MTSLQPFPIFPRLARRWPFIIAILTASFWSAHGIAQGPNQAPLCDLGDDISVPSQGPLTSVFLQPVTATDPDGSDFLLTYLWSLPPGSGAQFAGPPTTPFVLGLFPDGTTTVTLTVTDALGAGSSCSVDVTVGDDTPPLPPPPVISCEVNPATLWPPNHKMRRVAVTVQASSEAVDAPSSLSITCFASSNEPDRGSPGDRGGDVNGEDGFEEPVAVTLEFDPASGRFTGDLFLRAERLGSGDGRTYTIACTVEDPHGQTGDGTCAVSVPHDRGVGLIAVVQQQLKERRLAKKLKRKRKAAARNKRRQAARRRL